MWKIDTMNGMTTEPHTETPELQAEIDRQAELSARYHKTLERWNLLELNNPYVPEPVADLMREGVPPAPMLLDDWLYQGELHWLYAEAEAWKTWVALILAVDVMKAGRVVAWFDEELGKVFLVRRLLALGADPDVIEAKFAYFDFPNMAKDDADRHDMTLRAIAPALVVYDTATDMLTAAGLDENSGSEVTAWVKAFPERARQLGITQVVCDHTAKGGDRSVGSRAKRAKAKVEYFFEAEERGDENTVGRLRVTLKKNTPGNKLPQERIFAIGGDGNGGFVFDLLEQRASSTPAGRKVAKRDAVREQIERVLEAHGELNQSQLVSLTDGARSIVMEVAKSMATEPHVSGVASYPDGRSIKYRWVGKAALPE